MFFLGGGVHLVTGAIRVGVGEEGQGVPQRNRKGSTLRWPSVHPQPPLRCNTAAGSRGGRPDAFAIYALEWRRGRRSPEDLLGWGAIDDAGVKRLLGVVDGGRGIVDGLVEEAPQV